MLLLLFMFMFMLELLLLFIILDELLLVLVLLPKLNGNDDEDVDVLRLPKSLNKLPDTAAFGEKLLESAGLDVDSGCCCCCGCGGCDGCVVLKELKGSRLKSSNPPP